ncbi:MAG: hypothetical protein OEM43_03265 [Gammaproteobacteria bacterium]|nr:hypothetical protein [Gammaproteobacteria bacterium]
MKFCLSFSVIACLLTSAGVQANDFPTQERVEYVLNCMSEHGGQNYNSLYACVCTIDTIASRLSYDEFTKAVTYTNLRKTPGERGGLFRDRDRTGEIIELLAETRKDAERKCFQMKQ